jgi:CDP-diacylglycerol--glycerol-3-phosphate 3-phosphatidyltransferase
MREFMVTGIRLLAVDKGSVIAASPYGKFKTASTMVALVLMLFNDFGFTPWIANIIFYIAILFTVISGVDYLLKNKKVVFESI